MTKEEIINKNKKLKMLFFILKGGINMLDKKKKANSIEELSNQFEEVNNKYDYSNNKSNKISDSLSLTKLDDVNMNSDDITKLAKDSLRDYYTTNVNSINTKNDNEIQNLQNSINTQLDNANKLKNSVDNTIETVKQDASNDALKRGLARSSIVINQLNAFDKAKIDEYNKIDKELTNSVNKINDEINSLNSQKEMALKEFDITYASKLNEKINSLTKELQEKQEEVTKYNNEIAQIEAKYEKEKLNFNNNADTQDFKNYMDLNEFVAKYGVNSLNTLKNSEKYEFAFNYFSSLPKLEAYKIIQDNSNWLSNQLGTSYYNQLVNKFGYV